jgi:copper chaperone CopZ
VQSALSEVPGVVKAEVTMPDKAVVTFDKKKNVTAGKLMAAVKKAGYSAKEKKEKASDKKSGVKQSGDTKADK